MKPTQYPPLLAPCAEIATILIFTVAFVFTAACRLSAQDMPKELQNPPLTEQLPSQSPAPNPDASIETLFGNNVRYALIPMLKATPILGSFGTMLGLQAGAIISKNVMVGIGTFAVLNHDRVNMGYTGVLAEYRHAPHRLVHFGGSVLLGYGQATRGSGLRLLGLAENVGRLFSADFLVIEPSAFAEIHLNTAIALSLGASYRWIAGYRESLYDTFTNQNLSGVAVNLGVRFRLGEDTH
jgi:hypothetical protein